MSVTDAVKPNFLVIGAQKCATTSLCRLLGEHPDVFMTSAKEPHFFSDREVFVRGFSWYNSLFAHAKYAKAIGEGSTSYTMNSHRPDAPQLIFKYLPDVRLIYIVRHPIARIESAIMHRIKMNRKVWGVRKTLEEVPNIIDTTRYWKQISYYRKNYPDNRILILFFEDFVKSPKIIIEKCLDFLEVDASIDILGLNKPQNKSVGPLYYNRLGLWIRKIELIRMIKLMLPEKLIQYLQRPFQSQISSRPELDPDTHRWVLDQIRDDARVFLEYGGKPQDYWDLNDETKY